MKPLSWLPALLLTAARLSADARDEALLAAAQDRAVVKRGRENYVSLCQSCHGTEKDQSSEAPTNLFDRKWYHGGKPAEIERTIRTGVPDKGMTSWEEVLPNEEITALTAYLFSLQK